MGKSGSSSSTDIKVVFGFVSHRFCWMSMRDGAIDTILRLAWVDLAKWYKNIKNNTLIRNFAVKCWDNFDRDRIIKFVYDEFPEIKQVEDQSSSSIPDLLKGKSPEELAEICKLAAQACQAASASASGKGKSPASSEGSTTEMVNLSQFSASSEKELV
uniref:Uncharacterized protein n=1 Tax=Fagus sylvatica TaxID=28930 RepID=A0A2N9EH10_FAGSY